MNKNTRDIGKKGENKAKNYLQKKGFEILEENFYGKYGEIDLIIQDEKSTVIFVEVKYRKTKKYGLSQEVITRKKKKRMYLTALEYINKKNINDYNLRFDLIAINNTKITWIKNIIWGDEIGF
ncbi:MAG: YraN family protein [Fusobacteriota bacterium]